MTVIQLRIAELTCAQLDALVAHAEGLDTCLCRDDWGAEVLTVDGGVGDHGRLPRVPYSPSTSWADGGPIIERERISINTHAVGWGAVTSTQWDAGQEEVGGPTPLVAARRAFLTARVGETVELPA